MTVHGNGNRSEYGGKSGDGLDTAVKRAGAVLAPWPTPQVADAKHTIGENRDGRQIMLIHSIRDRAAISAPFCGLLNPDWVEWLMGWPFGWTDIAITSGVLYWLDLSDDPADWTPPLMQRITARKKHRVPRIETLGNGQVPLCAAVAFVWGFEILRVIVEG